MNTSFAFKTVPKYEQLSINFTFQKYEVKEVSLMENSSTNFSDVHGVKAVFSYIGSQIKPLFMPPYLKQTLLLSLHAFVLYAIALGLCLWYPFYYLNYFLKN